MNGLDIFCGGGGSSAGARSAGVSLRGAIDMCPVATDTYRSNFSNTHVVTSKLENVNVTKLKRQIGSIDILLASPECTNHTCAKGAAPRSEESRATALHAIAYAKAFRPRWVVIENVVHMRPWHRYGELKSELVRLGYNVAEQVIDSSDLGVAQTRKRLFLVADRARTPRLVELPPSRNKVGARQILDPPGTWKRSQLLARSRATGTLERANRAIAQVGVDEPFLVVYYGSDGGGGWQPLDRPLRTITTVDRFALVEPSPDGHLIRMLQVPELRRAMGFDDGYKLDMGTRRDKVRILGNGVCPPVMESVVRALTSD